MSNSVEVFMARQPIYRRNQELFAYELLFRQKDADEAGEVDREKAATALVSSLIDIGLKELIGDSRALVNVSPELLMSKAIGMLPKDRVVIEILETVQPVAEVIEQIQALRAQGFTIALDDYDPTPENEVLLKVADIVKIDVLCRNEAQIRNVFRQVKRPGIEVLAERVESREKYRLCEKLGFHLFQGYYFAKPELMKGNSLQANQLAMLRLAARLQSPNLQYAELEEIISTDVALSFRLLKFVKSAHFGIHATVTSVRQALMFLGVNTVSAIATLLAMAGSTNESEELLRTSLIRAKMCELLALHRQAEQKERYFTVGMMSLLDALFNVPMNQVLAELPLDTELNQALNGENPNCDLSRTLETVTAYERGEWDSCPLDGVTCSELSQAYHAAVCWSTTTELAA